MNLKLVDEFSHIVWIMKVSNNKMKWIRNYAKHKKFKSSKWKKDAENEKEK